MLKFLAEMKILVGPYGAGKLVSLLLVMIGQVAAQTLSLVALFVFFTAISDPASFREGIVGGFILTVFGDLTRNDLISTTGIATLGAFALASMFSLWAEYTRAIYAHDIGRWLRHRLVTRILAQDYEYFFNRSTSVLTKKIMQDVMVFVQQILMPLLEAMMRGLFAVALLGWVSVLSPSVGLVVFLFAVGYYVLVVRVVRNRSKATSDGIKEATRGTYFTIGQAFSGIKAIYVANLQQFFIALCEEPSRRLASLVPKVVLLSSAPRYILEFTAFAGFILWIALALKAGKSFAEVGSTIAIFAIIMYRLGPSLQIIIAQVVTISSMRQSMEEILDELEGPETERPEKARAAVRSTRSGAAADVTFERLLCLQGVSFRYESSHRTTIAGVTLDVPCGSHIAFVGPTGSGKSTIVELVLGLLTPTFGSISVDGVELGPSNRASWRRLIGYVPQDLFLLDASVAENIALGCHREAIDHARMKDAAEIAQAASFIETELASGYDTVVGERGVMLSGGQRQRIGIARALYRRPKLLILDEATSALDNATEHAVMAGLTRLADRPTIITVAHRLSTIRNCDYIYFISDGSVDAGGKFDELRVKHRQFRSLVVA